MTDHTDILNTIHTLRAQLDSLEAKLSGRKVTAPSEPVADKPKRGASDALKAWNAYVDQVKADMLASGWVHPETGKPVTRKDAMQEASKRRATDPDAPKPKPKPTKDEAPPSDGEASGKPKRTLSDEQKAKMAEGRKASAERLKATLESSNLKPLTVKGRKYLMDPDTNGCYKVESGNQGAWAGVYDAKTKSIDTSVADPSA